MQLINRRGNAINKLLFSLKAPTSKTNPLKNATPSLYIYPTHSLSFFIFHHGFSKPHQITSHCASALCGTVLPKDVPREGALRVRPCERTHQGVQVLQDPRPHPREGAGPHSQTHIAGKD